MRAAGDADAEAWVLTTEAGRDLLARVAAVARPGPADLARWRKTAVAEHVAAAVRLARSRTRGASKFARAERMWFDPIGLEQATAELVARHKALRFAGRTDTVVDLCCGVGGDALALASGAGVLAVDIDPGMGRRALWNARAYGVDDRVAAARTRAQDVAIPAGAWVHIDPDRRASKGVAARARRLDGYEPGLDFLRSLTRTVPGGAVKVGPASDFADHFGGPGLEVELVSLGGECKEATVWFGAAVTCRRRATTLPAGATWTDRDGPAGYAPLGPVLAWVFDPDPSLSRAGLLDAFALAHGLARFAPGIDLLTAADPVASPFLSPFEVVGVFPLDLKRLRREVAARRIGPLDVKTRGLDLSPEAVRARLKPPGGQPATLILVGCAGQARALLARRPATG